MRLGVRLAEVKFRARNCRFISVATRTVEQGDLFAEALGTDVYLYPFEKMTDAAGWFDRVDTISETDWVKIARNNAEKLLNLELGR